MIMQEENGVCYEDRALLKLYISCPRNSAISLTLMIKLVLSFNPFGTTKHPSPRDK